MVGGVATVVNRRIFLKAVGGSSVAGLTVLAGCSSSGSSGANGSGNGSTASGSAGGGEQNATTGSETAAPTGTNASATGTSGGQNASSTGSGGSGGGSKTVGMYTEGGDYYFDPIGLFVEKGTTVSFKDESGSHSSVAYKKGTGSAETTRIPEGAEAWNSDIVSEGESYDHTFDTEGTYDYFCLPHKSLGMVGRIVVGSPGGPAEGSMPPDGKVPKSDAIVEKESIAYSDFS